MLLFRIDRTAETVVRRFVKSLRKPANSSRPILTVRRLLFPFVVMVVISTGCLQKNPGGPQVKTSSPALPSPYEMEKKTLPEKVHALFYAVKDSLDYASVTDGIDGPLQDLPEDPLPRESLQDYERVTKDVMEEFNREFIVERYRVNGWDYELVVSKRKRPQEKYMATRVQMFRLKEGKWESIGAYLHW